MPRRTGRIDLRNGHGLYSVAIAVAVARAVPKRRGSIILHSAARLFLTALLRWRNDLLNA